MEYGVIMAGGSGDAALAAVAGRPPQAAAPVVRGKSLLQLSWERLRGLLPPDRIFVCTNAAHGDAVLENLPELSRENLLGEPTGRDTANAVGFSAAVLRSFDPDAVMAITTADHVIEPVENFQNAVRTAFDAVAEDKDALVTFGIVPTFGHTGLGYIHRGEPLTVKGKPAAAHRVQAFKEKPDKPTADRYVESGRYYWNSGMFVWRCDTVLNELATHLPNSYRGLTQIATSWAGSERQAVLSKVYPELPKISIDYAVMEPASQNKGKAHVTVVEMPVQWLDVGSWPQLAETLETDTHNNAVDAPAHVVIDSDDNIIISEEPHHLITTIGVSDMIIVHTPEATLVCPKNDAQRVKDLVAKVKEKYGNRYL